MNQQYTRRTKYMKNKKLEKLLEEIVAKKESLGESELGSAAAEPVHTEKAPKEHTPEIENSDVYPADEHEQAEEVEEVIVEGEEEGEKEALAETYTQEDLEELFESLNLDTDKYTFEYLAEELGFVPVEDENGIPDLEAIPAAQEESEYDEEGSMAKSQLVTIADAAAELHNMLSDNQNLPEWAQAKITLTKDYIDKVRDYMKSQVHAELEDHSVSQEVSGIEMDEMPAEESLQERYILKRPVGRPSKKSKMLDAKGPSSMNSKGEVVYTKGGK
jgi:hypothetical protein